MTSSFSSLLHGGNTKKKAFFLQNNLAQFEHKRNRVCNNVIVALEGYRN
jgi:hypothetical protein